MTKKKDSAEKTIRDIRRATRRQYSAEEKIRTVLEGLQPSNLMLVHMKSRNNSTCYVHLKKNHQ